MSPTTRPTRILGRQAETDEAEGVLAEAKLGLGRLIVVAGDPGIGKTTMLRAIQALAESDDIVCLTSRAVASGGSLRPISEALVPALRDAALTDHDELEPYRFALSRLLPGWHQDAPPTQMDPTVLLGEAVLKLIGVLYPDRSALLAVDDVQWADVETLALLEYLAGAIRRLPIVLAVGVRTADSGEVLRLARRTDSVVLQLSPLSDEHIAAVAEQRAGERTLPAQIKRFVAAKAEGLPLLAEELVDGLIRSGVLVADAGGWQMVGELTTQVPHTFAQLARSRLAELGTSTGRDVLIAAAVVGRSVDWTLLAAVLDIDEGQIQEGIEAAVDLQLLQRADGPGARYRWRHGLLREAVLDQAPHAEVRRMSRKAATALATTAISAGLYAETDLLVVDLLLRAGDHNEAASKLVALASVSLQRGAMRSAEEALDRAADLSVEAEVRAESSIQRVRLLTLTGRAREAVTSSDLLLLGVEGEQRNRLLIALARAAVGTGEWAASIGFLDRVSPSVGSPQVDAVRADAHYGAGRLGDARQLAQAAVEDPGLAETPELLSGAYEVLARCARMEDPGESARLFRRAADVAESAGLAPARVRALFGLGSARLLAGDDFTFFREVRELALDAGLLAEAAGADLMIGEDLVAQSRPRSSDTYDPGGGRPCCDRRAG